MVDGCFGEEGAWGGAGLLGDGAYGPYGPNGPDWPYGGDGEVWRMGAGKVLGCMVLGGVVGARDGEAVVLGLRRGGNDPLAGDGCGGFY